MKLVIMHLVLLHDVIRLRYKYFPIFLHYCTLLT